MMERWPSGLRRTLGKCVYCQRYRGFESHSLRHICGQKLYFFIKKFKNVINNLSKKKIIWQKITHLTRQTP